MDLINPLNQAGMNQQATPPQAASSNPNFLTQTSVTRVGLPRGFWKAIGLDICTVLAAVNVGYTYALYFDGERSFGVLFASAAVYTLLSLFEAFFMVNTGRRIFVMLLEVLGLIAFFFAMPIDALSIIVFAASVFFLWGYLAARSELKNGLEVRFWRTARSHMTKFVTGFSIALVLLYAPQFTAGKVFMSEDGFAALTSPISLFVQKIYPAIDLSASAGKLAEGLAASQLQGNESFDKLSDTQKSQFMAQTVRQVLDNMGKSLNLKIDPDMPVWRVIYGYINNLFGNLQKQLGDKFTLAWAVLLFAAVRGISAIIIWPMLFTGFLFYELLLALNFAHITGERRTQEVLELS